MTEVSAIGRERLIRLTRWAFTMSGASAVNLLCAFAVLIINVRYLGASQLGILALISTIYILVGKLVSLETWQAVVKLGAEAKQDDRPGGLARIVAVGFLLDMVSALVAAGVALGTLHIVGPHVGIPDDILPVASIVALVLATRIFGTPSGVLRIAGRFGLTAWIQIGEAVVRLVAVVVLVTAGAPFEAFIMAYAAVFAASNLALLTAGITVARKERMLSDFAGMRNAIVNSLRPVFRYSLGTSLANSLAPLQNHLGILFVGWFLDTHSVGIYHVASRIALVMSIVARPIPIVLFPDLAALAAKREFGTILRLLGLAVALCGLGGAVYTGFFMVMGPGALELIAGSEFVSGYTVLILLLLAQSIILLAFAPTQFLLACSGPRRVLISKLITLVVFATAMPASLFIWGLDGAGIGLLMTGITLFVTTTLSSWLLLDRQLRPAALVPAGNAPAEPR